MTMPDITAQLLELIRLTSTDLPADVEAALRQARDREAANSPARDILDLMLANVQLARTKQVPLCQDTGTALFYVDYPAGWSTLALRAQIEAAVAKATSLALLRPNAVDSLTGQNSGTNIGAGLPGIHFAEWERPELRVRLMLKGGGSENISAQYSLPMASLHAGRDLEGVRRVVLHCLQQAQGQGCAPGVVGVCIGGDRGQAFDEAKRQLLRPLDDVNPEPALAELEQRIVAEGNALGIGPMGLGGKTTLLGAKIGALHRLPASFFVTISYMCWQYRRRQMVIRGDDVAYA